MIQLTHTRVAFEKGRILTAEMLSAMESNHENTMKALFPGNENAVVHGLDVTVDGDDVLLSAGIVKFSGELYVLPETISLNSLFDSLSLNDNVHYWIMLKPVINDISGAIRTDRLELTAVQQTPDKKKEGLILASNYGKSMQFPKSLRDLYTYYNTNFNLWECNYSYNGLPAIHPSIAALIRKRAYSDLHDDSYDMALAQQIMSVETVSLELLKWYMLGKKATVPDEFRTMDTLKILAELIESQQKTAPVEAEAKKPSYFAQEAMKND